MEYKIPVTKETYVKAVLMSINFLLNLTNFEIKILCAMINNNMLEVNIDTREHIRKVLNKDKFMTNNYIKSLRTKGVLLDHPKNSKVYYINPTIIDIIKEGKISFEFGINDN